MTTFLRLIYTGLLLLLLPFVFFRLYWKGRHLPAYRVRWGERVGLVNLPKTSDFLWVHAVSVGESLSAVPFIRRFQALYPTASVLVTTMTPTGSERVRAAFANDTQVFNVYVPYDIPFFIQRLIKKIKPRMFIAMETEIWPNLFNQLKKHDVPLLIANARLSLNSLTWYKRLGRCMRELLKPVSRVAAQTTLDADRFIDIGVCSSKVSTIGNIKFDFDISDTDRQAGRTLKKLLGPQVLVAASTHAGEETILLEVFEALKKDLPDLVLLLVPRHPNRFNEVYALCQKTTFRTHRRSVGPLTGSVDIYLGDTMGEMMTYYAASDVAFVGGSLVDIGGHNLLEPAALELPIVTGPYLSNFQDIARLLQSEGGVAIVQNKEALIQKAKDLFLSEIARKHMGQKAKKVVDQNRGAIDKLLEITEALWESNQSHNMIER